MGRTMKKYLYYFGVIVVSILAGADAAFAEAGANLYLPLGIGFTIGLAALGGTFAQGKAISSGLDSIGRNPSSRGDIFIPMLIGLAFVESLVVLAFVISIQLIGQF